MKKFAYVWLIASMVVSSAAAKTTPGVSTQFPERTTDVVTSLPLIGSNVAINSPEYAEVTFDSGKLYVSGTSPGLQIHDVSSLPSITPLGIYSGDQTYGLGVSGNTALVGGTGDFSGYIPFYVLDVSNPSSPAQVGSGTVTGLSDGPSIVSVQLFGTTAAILSKDLLHGSQLDFWDISTPSSPTRISSGTPPAAVTYESELYLSGTKLYQLGNSGAGVVDVSDPANPTHLSSFSVNTSPQASLTAIAGKDEMVFIGDANGSVKFFDTSVSPAVETGSIQLGQGVKDLLIEGDYLLALTSEQLTVYHIGRVAEGDAYLTGSQGDFTSAHHVLGDGTTVYILEDDHIFAYDATQAYVEPSFPVITYTETVTSGFPEIQSSLSVTEVFDSNTPYTGLTSDNFTLTENLSSQTISVQEGTPGSYVLTYTTEDLSGQGQSRDLHLVLTYEGEATDSVDVTYVVPSIELTVGTVDVSEFPSISFPATVVNENGVKRTGLTTAHFELVENAVTQTVSSVTEQADSTYIVGYTPTDLSHVGNLRTLNVTIDYNGLEAFASVDYTEPTIAPALSVELVDGLLNFPTLTVMMQVTDEIEIPVAGLAASDITVEENGIVPEQVSFGNVGDGYYIIGYTSPNGIPDGTTRSVEYSVTSGDLSDVASTTYDAPLPPSLTIGNGEAVLPNVADVPITVESFGNVSVMEFYINYDPSKVTFENITSDVAEGIVFNASDGNLILSWFSTNPMYLDDGDTLLTMHFATDGFEAAGYETSPVTWAEGTYMANYDADLFEGITYEDGSVIGLSHADISGVLSYFTSSIPLAGAEVGLVGDTTLSATSDENGAYLFEAILPGSYSVGVLMSDEGHPGVNTLDAYRIQISLDDINPFESGYQYFAADVDQTHLVNTMDAYKIQRVVVGLDEGFDAPDWAFISSSFAMTTENWADAELYRSFDLMGIDSTGLDFYGVRRGDANNSWPNLFLETTTEEEITGSLTIADAVVGPGGRTTVELEALGLGEIGALEWHLEFNPDVVTLLDYDLPGIGGEVVTTTDSTISVSWFNVASAMNCDARILGYLTFEAVEQVNVESDLHLYRVVLGDDSGEELWTDVQDGTITVANMSDLNYQGAELVSEWQLRPSYPNPFNAYTTLSFDVKDASEVQIHIYNVLGDLVETLVQGNLPKGRYTKSVNAQNWSSGTYFVVMKTQSFNKVQKIVLLK